MSKETIYWTTKAGDQIDVDKMTLSHLRNTLKMLIKEHNYYIDRKFEDYRESTVAKIEFENKENLWKK